MKEILNKAKNFISMMSTIFILSLAILLVGIRIFGYIPYTVVSGSMSPAIPTGSIVYTKQIDLNEIKIGNTITYLVDQSGLLSTHRVVEIDYEKNLITTKGDANQNNDSQKVQFKNIQGVVKYHLPLLGYISNYVHSIKGIQMLVILIIAMLVRSLIDKSSELALRQKRKKKEHLNEAKQT